MLQSSFEPLGKVDPDFILDDQQYFCTEEVRIALGIIKEISEGNSLNKLEIESQLSQITNHNIEDVDTPVLTKKFYQTIINVASDNPVCSVKRLFSIWKQTKMPHRKLMITLLGYYLGFIKDVSKWIDSEYKNLVKTRNIDAAIETILYDKLNKLKVQKELRIKDATTLEKSGYILEPLAIMSKECPNLITNHLNFVNAMIKYQFNANNNMELLSLQFKSSILILIKNLQQQNPKHPKVVKIEKIQKTVLSKIEKIRKLKKTEVLA